MPPSTSKLSTFLSELKRRRVFRVAAVYAGVAFVIFQIIDSTFVLFDIPDWVGRFLVIALVLGFPIVIGLAWAFDITEKGIVRTAKEPAEAKVPRRVLIGNKTLAIVAAVAVAVAVWSWWGRPSETFPDKSIAVLPFINLSDSKDDEYFSDGITEDIIARLARISDLTVIGRTSVMQYKNTTERLRDIGEELGVATLLEGSVRRTGGKVRIVSQLIDARTEKHLWAATYNREVDEAEIFALQSDVAEKIATALEATLSPEEKQRIEKRPTANMAAYEAYLKGRYFWNKRTGEGLLRAIDYFERAIEEDDSYAQAYTGIADCYSTLPYYGGWLPNEAYPKALAAAMKALDLDDKLAEAHNSLAAVKFWFEWDFITAEREFKRAIELNPSYAASRHWYGLFLASLGRFNEGIKELRQALELDPLSLIINCGRGEVLYWARRYDAAIEQFQKTIEMNPDFNDSHEGLGLVFLQKGLFEKAIEEFKKSGSFEIAYPYAVTGRKDEALRVLEGLERRSTQEHIDPALFARVYLGLGEMEQALEALERGYEERSLRLLHNGPYVDPYYDPLRSDPRFQDLLRRMNFPE